MRFNIDGLGIGNTAGAEKNARRASTAHASVDTTQAAPNKSEMSKALGVLSGIRFGTGCTVTMQGLRCPSQRLHFHLHHVQLDSPP